MNALFQQELKNYLESKNLMFLSVYMVHNEQHGLWLF